MVAIHRKSRKQFHRDIPRGDVAAPEVRIAHSRVAAGSSLAEDGRAQRASVPGFGLTAVPSRFATSESLPLESIRGDVRRQRVPGSGLTAVDLVQPRRFAVPESFPIDDLLGDAWRHRVPGSGLTAVDLIQQRRMATPYSIDVDVLRGGLIRGRAPSSGLTAIDIAQKGRFSAHYHLPLDDLVGHTFRRFAKAPPAPSVGRTVPRRNALGEPFYYDGSTHRAPTPGTGLTAIDTHLERRYALGETLPFDSLVGYVLRRLPKAPVGRTVPRRAGLGESFRYDGTIRRSPTPGTGLTAVDLIAKRRFVTDDGLDLRNLAGRVARQFSKVPTGRIINRRIARGITLPEDGATVRGRIPAEALPSRFAGHRFVYQPSAPIYPGFVVVRILIAPVIGPGVPLCGELNLQARLLGTVDAQGSLSGEAGTKASLLGTVRTYRC